MKTVIEMARGVKATAYTNRHYPDRTTYTFGPEQLEAFAELVRADERERLHDKFMEIHKSQQHSNNYWHFAARKIKEQE